jgi:CelD/BcsL family acetyltransferase involved in cellulose biosynthesis
VAKAVRPVRISVARPGDLGTAELDRWADLQRRDPSLANPFLSAPFALATARARGGCQVAILEDGPGERGFLPYERSRIGVGRAIGSGISDCQGLVHSPGLDWDAAELLHACGLGVWEFDHLLASQAPFKPHHEVAARSPVLDLSQGWKHYLEERRPSTTKLVKSTLYKQRKLGREVGEVRFEYESADRAALRALMAWKSSQYRRTGRYDRFARPWIVRLVDELYETGGPDFAGVLSVLYAGDRPVAAHFGIRSASVLSWWFPAYDVEFSRYSPGLILLLRLAESAAAAGIGQLDLGKGHEDYKESFKSGDLAIAEGWVQRPSPAAALRWMLRTPPRAAREFVGRHPSLRHGARGSRDLLGRLRGGPQARPGGASPAQAPRQSSKRPAERSTERS